MPHIGAPIDTQGGQNGPSAPKPDQDPNLDDLDEGELEARLKAVLELDDE